MAARKKAAKKRKRPEHPGRFIPGHHWEGALGESAEFVTITLDEAKSKTYRERVVQLEDEAAKVETKIRDEKSKLSDFKREAIELTKAIVHGTLEKRATVFKFADDAAGTVSLYDAETDELLQTRELEDEERQENLELEDGEQEEEAEEQGEEE